jgi:prepilin peptidase CpaA
MMHMLLTAVIGGVVIGAAISDAMTFRIPNAFPLILVGLFLVSAITTIPTDALLWHVVAGVAVLVAGMGLFALNVIGGGDAKLLAATSLLAGPVLLMPLVMFISLAGLALALTIYLLRAIGVAAWLQRRGMRGFAGCRMCPYGVAIAGGWVLLFVVVPALPHLIVIPASGR